MFKFRLCTVSVLALMLVSLPIPAHAQGLTPASSFKIDVESYASGFNLPVYLTNAGDGSGRVFVVEKPGRILILKDGKQLDQPFLDITSLVRSEEQERGLLGVAFHPKYKSNGLFFVYYTDLSGQLTIARYHVSSDPNSADPNSAKILITVKHALSNHNGGSILFGPDGYLYFGMGDGGGGGDPFNNGQNKQTLLAKISRIDVDKGDTYGIPADNPFADGKDGRAEIWEYGLRNPWRFSFDSATGDMFIADVGQDLYEEVDYIKAGTPGGLDFGWSIMEGLHCFNADTCDQTGLTLPVLEYPHDDGNCSITGGYVYRGKVFPKLQGTYFYSDYCGAHIWALQPADGGKWTATQVFQIKKAQISSFGVDEAGELYVIDINGGTIYHLVDKS